eukprot:GHVN01040812.1.p1 GENE.GHVN01040812.1~~GHVN01040812.1.p1  ORF type:complete len:1167 (+),score=145.26 GHVN01040812.1:238-3738(+)
MASATCCGGSGRHTCAWVPWSRICFDFILVIVFLVCAVIIIINEGTAKTVGGALWSRAVVTFLGGTVGFFLLVWVIELVIVTNRCWITDGRLPSLDELEGLGYFLLSIKILFGCCFLRGRRTESEMAVLSAKTQNVFSDPVGYLNRFRRFIAHYTVQPPFVIASILINIGWCSVWVVCLVYVKRDDVADKWDIAPIPNSVWMIQEIFLTAATLEFLTRYLRQVSIVTYFISFSFLIDLITLPPLIIITVQIMEAVAPTPLTYNEYFFYFGFIRWLRTFVIVRFIGNSALFSGPQTTFRLFQLGMGIFLLILTFASAMMTVEGVVPAGTNGIEELFVEWFYFGVVTLSTVGYGDISPSTGFGRWVTILFIAGVLMWIPVELNSVLEAFYDGKQQVGSMPNIMDRNRTALVLGEIEPTQLGELLLEIYRSGSNSIRKVTVLSLRSFRDYDDQVSAANGMQISLSIRYGDVGVGGCTDDGDAVSAADVKAVILVSNPRKGDLRASDQQSLSRLLSLAKMGTPLQRICGQFATDAMLPVMEKLGIKECYSFHSIKMALLSRTLVEAPGLSSMIVNLVSARSTEERLSRNEKQGAANCEERLEFFRGANMTFIRFKIPKLLYGMIFDHLALRLFTTFDTILLGLVRQQTSPLSPSKLDVIGRQDSIAYMNPTGMMLELVPGDTGIAIAPHPYVADYLEGLLWLPWPDDSDDEVLVKEATEVSYVPPHTLIPAPITRKYTNISSHDDGLRSTKSGDVEDDSETNDAHSPKILPHLPTGRSSQKMGLMTVTPRVSVRGSGIGGEIDRGDAIDLIKQGNIVDGADDELEGEVELLTRLTVNSWKDAVSRWKRKGSNRPFVLVCGWPRHLHRLVEHLSSQLNVIVLSHNVSPDYANVSGFVQCEHSVALIQGRPTQAAALDRAGAAQAVSGIIFPEVIDTVNDEASVKADAEQDRAILTTYLRLRHFMEGGDGTHPHKSPLQEGTSGSYSYNRPLPKIFIDLRDPSHCFFFDSDLWIPPAADALGAVSARYMRSQLFAEGYLFSDHLIYGMLGKCGILSERTVPVGVIAALVGNCEVKPYLDGVPQGLENATLDMASLDQTGLQLIPSGVQPGTTRTWGEVFKSFLVERNYMALGVYRTRYERGDTFSPYVATNPEHSSQVLSSDQIYVVPRSFV